ncbi:TPA: replication initiator protein A, partial [Staphylococcus aureus]
INVKLNKNVLLPLTKLKYGKRFFVMQNQYFTVQENYKERFYQIPKVFFTSENYKNLTNDMKIAYAILRDRLNLSIKNSWVDEDGNIYFVYSNEKLMEILNCKKEKLTKIKKGLENDGLLIQKRRGLNKPNILYLMKPIVTERDIYKIEKEENDVEPYGEKEVRKSNVQKFENRTLMILTLMTLTLMILRIMI